MGTAVIRSNQSQTASAICRYSCHSILSALGAAGRHDWLQRHSRVIHLYALLENFQHICPNGRRWALDRFTKLGDPDLWVIDCSSELRTHVIEATGVGQDSAIDRCLSVLRERIFRMPC